MSKSVLLDTGPLVAILNRRDKYHEWAKVQWGQITTPLFTCEAVLSEAFFLLAGNQNGIEALLKMLQREVLTIPFHVDEHFPPITKLLKKYRNVPISLADACLVRMSELYPEHIVFTLDSDFNLYRRNGRQVIPTLMPS